MRNSFIALLTVLVLVVAACSGSDGEDATGDEGDTVTSTTTTSAGAGEDGSSSDSTTTTAGSSGGGIGAGGSATLTVGDQVYEFDSYYCFQGADTGNDRVSFSSGAIGEIDGVRVQLDASIQDVDEGGAMDGASSLHSVSLNDIEDFENPIVSWDAVTGFLTSPQWIIEYDGSSVTATITADDGFDDTSTDDWEQIEGSLTATCP